ncbi:MAG: DUF4169 family protein [Rhodospirillales bacterium]
MSADIINFNQYRKSRQKTENQAKASENRTRFGRSRAQKLVDVKQQEIADKILGGKKLKDDDKEEDEETPT